MEQEVIKRRIKDFRKTCKVKILIGGREYEGEIVKKNGQNCFVGKIINSKNSRISNNMANFGPKTKIEISKRYMEENPHQFFDISWYAFEKSKMEILVKDCETGKNITANVNFGDEYYFSVAGEIIENKGKKWFTGEGSRGKEVKFGQKPK